MEQHMLVVFPHPDDETFGCGGTIASYARSGMPITYICGTLGQMGRNMGTITQATRESLAKIRETELEEASRILGISKLIKLGLRDKTVEFEDPNALATRIEQVLREIKPSLVLTHYPGYAIHPDHNAMGAVTIAAVSRLAKQDRPTVYAHALQKTSLGPPDVVKDITAVADVKLAAIEAHHSQSEASFARDENGKFKDPAVAARAQTMFTKETFWTYRFE